MGQHQLSGYGYKYWGWIKPDGKIVDGLQSDFSNHYELLKDLTNKKIVNSGKMIDDGWVRWASDLDDNMHFEFTAVKSIPNIIKFIKLTTIANTFTFDSPGSDRKPLDEKAAILWLKNRQTIKESTEDDKKWPLVKNGMVADLEVIDHIDNISSISATFDNYKIWKGVREIPISEFITEDTFDDRIRNLADQIKTNKEIMPLIVAIDKEGPWILEGAHRFDALTFLKYKSLPALVVETFDDQEELKEVHQLPYYGQWGWIDDDGMIIDGQQMSSRETHSSLVASIGLSTIGAIKSGWVRWHIQNEILYLEYRESQRSSIKYMLDFITKSKYSAEGFVLDEFDSEDTHRFDSQSKVITFLKSRLHNG